MYSSTEEIVLEARRVKLKNLIKRISKWHNLILFALLINLVCSFALCLDVNSKMQQTVLEIKGSLLVALTLY